ncbi:DUF5712 family protein [Hymenobacter sp. BT635]|uniref:DUF5712 family protein n=1 Tax=Hymenobacter nitidus TaxID=2880929 RepID=A0ABS8AJM7_9BACT|nr:DUF5712 family protein [Hymenobacter nitidus]MCB2380476.1 DUF5712 family protein [Hymenobacter nitidus]
MYIKIINPATNGKNAYSNRGSARQATNYLEGEAKKQGEKAVFFNANRDDISGDEAVQLIDSNRKGLRKDDAKFYSLVISPSAQELEHIGHDPQKLQAYTARVMQEYAATFVTKSGQPLTEKDLVWVATRHDERKHRGHDGAPSGQPKEGPQTHLHLMVSARDAQQKLTLNPLGSAARFNRVSFMAKANVAFEEQFGPVKQAGRRGQEAGQPDEQEAGTAGRRRTQTAEEMADSIGRRAAANEGQSASSATNKGGSRSPRTGDDLRDKQLFNQVDRVNKTLPADRQLVHNQVLEAARKMDYSKAFYGRLGQLGKEGAKQNYHDYPYEFLRTGKDAKTAASTIAENQKRDNRLLEQVERLNKKLPQQQQLAPNQVLEIAREQEYSKAFYGRLNRIGREANTRKAVREPYAFLRTGRVHKPEKELRDELPSAAAATARLPRVPPTYSRPGTRMARTYQPSAARNVAGVGQELSRALGTHGYTQDVRGDEDRE